MRAKDEATEARREAAISELLDAGAENVKKEDRHGDTRSGWFVDGVFLSKDPVEALKYLRGAG